MIVNRELKHTQVVWSMDNNWKVNVVIFDALITSPTNLKAPVLEIKTKDYEWKVSNNYATKRRTFLISGCHPWLKISVLELYKNLVLVFSSPSVFTLSWGKIITIIYLAHCQLRVFLLMDASRQAVDSYHPISWFEIWMKFSHYLDNLPCMVFIFQPFLSHSWQWTLLEHLKRSDN